MYENPCWEGYRAYGLKMKDGKKVPNCIPEKKSSVSNMPYHLERYKDKAIVVNTKTGKHHSLSPIPIQNAKAQMRVLEAAAKKEGKK